MDEWDAGYAAGSDAMKAMMRKRIEELEAELNGFGQGEGLRERVGGLDAVSLKMAEIVSRQDERLHELEAVAAQLAEALSNHGSNCSPGNPCEDECWDAWLGDRKAALAAWEKVKATKASA